VFIFQTPFQYNYRVYMDAFLHKIESGCDSKNRWRDVIFFSQFCVLSQENLFIKLHRKRSIFCKEIWNPRFLKLFLRNLLLKMRETFFLRQLNVLYPTMRNKIRKSFCWSFALRAPDIWRIDFTRTNILVLSWFYLSYIFAVMSWRVSLLPLKDFTLTMNTLNFSQ
jgi:hypothetical protein